MCEREREREREKREREPFHKLLISNVTCDIYIHYGMTLCDTYSPEIFRPASNPREAAAAAAR